MSILEDPGNLRIIGARKPDDIASEILSDPIREGGAYHFTYIKVEEGGQDILATLLASHEWIARQINSVSFHKDIYVLVLPSDQGELKSGKSYLFDEATRAIRGLSAGNIQTNSELKGFAGSFIKNLRNLYMSVAWRTEKERMESLLFPLAQNLTINRQSIIGVFCDDETPEAIYRALAARGAPMGCLYGRCVEGEEEKLFSCGGVEYFSSVIAFSSAKTDEPEVRNLDETGRQGHIVNLRKHVPTYEPPLLDQEGRIDFAIHTALYRLHPDRLRISWQESPPKPDGRLPKLGADS